MGELKTAIGHEQVRQWLTGLIDGDKAVGSFLFVGPDGIGKSTVALEFAATLRCHSRASGWACGNCNECVRVARGVHPSVRLFYKPDEKQVFPVDSVREICDEASIKAFEPGKRVFIIADADRFNDASANAFLKSLEEPPEDTIFVLLAGNVAQVLPTILSRCPAVRFTGLNEDQIREVSTGWEGLPVNPASREVLTRAAQGSPGMLRSMADRKVMDTARDFLKSVVRDPFEASQVLVSATTDDPDNEAKRRRLREVLALLSAALRDRLMAALEVPSQPLVKAYEDEELSADRLVASIQKLDDLRGRVDRNVNLKLCCDQIALCYPV
ncbi:MAG: DNA polymerase III subunit [Planctomycetota bacterium]|jgi:DNA polymerase-3 subunit delta'